MKECKSLGRVVPVLMVLSLGVWGCSSVEKKKEMAKSQNTDPVKKVTENVIPGPNEDFLVVEFGKASNEVPESQQEKTEKIAEILKDKKGAVAHLEGHSDGVGNPEYNMKLSEKRAEALRSLLVEKYNIDPARLTAKGLGSSQPVADDTTDEGRQKNRRVVVQIEEEKVQSAE